MRYATRIPAGNAAASISASGITVTDASTVAVSAAIAVAITSAAPAPSTTPAVPRAGADEDAAIKPARTVVAIRSASIRVIGVVAPGAIRRTVVIRRANHCGTYAYSHRDLGIRGRNGSEGKNEKHCDQNQAEFPHDILLVLSRLLSPGSKPEFSGFSTLAGRLSFSPDRLLTT
jgi:hypothetical protein